MKLFNLMQDNDIIIAEGVTFTDGRCALNWLNSNYKKITGMAFFDCEDHIIEIHGHNSRVKIQYLDKQEDFKPKIKDKPEYVQYGSPECYVQDPNKMCKMCSCWKITRNYCS